MNKIFLGLVGLFLFAPLLLSSVDALTGDEMVTLKKAGIRDETIQLMVKEKSQETGFLTASEVLELKKSGMSEKTIRVLIKNGSFLKNKNPIIYGKDIRSIQFVTAGDVIKLKNSGLSDEIIESIIIFGSRNAKDEEREKAWEMLNNMKIRVDMR